MLSFTIVFADCHYQYLISVYYKLSLPRPLQNYTSLVVEGILFYFDLKRITLIYPVYNFQMQSKWIGAHKHIGWFKITWRKWKSKAGIQKKSHLRTWGCKRHLLPVGGVKNIIHTRRISKKSVCIYLYVQCFHATHLWQTLLQEMFSFFAKLLEVGFTPTLNSRSAYLLSPIKSISNTPGCCNNSFY